MGDAGRDSGPIGSAAALAETDVVDGALGGSGDEAEGDGSTKDLEVVVVDLILEAGRARLIETMKLIEVDTIAIGHEQAVKDHGEPALSKTIDGFDLAEHKTTLRNEDVLSIVGIDGVRNHDLHRTGEVPIQAVDQGGFDYGSFK